MGIEEQETNLEVIGSQATRDQPLGLVVQAGVKSIEEDILSSIEVTSLNNISDEAYTAIQAAERKARKPLSQENKQRIIASYLEGKTRREERADRKEAIQIAQALERILSDFAAGGLVNPHVDHANPLQILLRQMVFRGDALRLLLFWGASEKIQPDEFESKLIARINQLAMAIQQNYPAGVEPHVVWADTHAISNGYGNWQTGLSAQASQYYENVKTILQKSITWKVGTASWNEHTLSALYRDHGLEMVPPAIPDHNPAFEKHSEYLLENAKKHSTEADADLSARRYVQLREREKVILQTNFEGYILIAPGVSIGAADIILPKGMPAVFFGSRVKAPWFYNR